MALAGSQSLNKLTRFGLLVIAVAVGWLVVVERVFTITSIVSLFGLQSTPALIDPLYNDYRNNQISKGRLTHSQANKLRSFGPLARIVSSLSVCLALSIAGSVNDGASSIAGLNVQPLQQIHLNHLGNLTVTFNALFSKQLDLAYKLNS